MEKETVLITGATSGIGKSLAYRFAEHYKYNLVLIGRNLSKLELISHDLAKKYEIKIYILNIDLCQKNSSTKIINFLEENNIDVSILINNAGIGQWSELENTSVQHTEDLISLNISSVVNLTKDFLPILIKRGGGKILNVSSVVAYYPMPKSSIYAASKSFINFFSESLRIELKKHNIQVSLLCPGATNTNLANNFQNYYKNENKINTNNKTRNILSKVSLSGLMDSNKVAEITINEFLKNKSIIIPGLRNKIITFIMINLGSSLKNFLLSLKQKK